MPTSASAKRTTTTAKRTSKAVTRVKPRPVKPKEPESDIEVIATDEAEGTFTARVFGTEHEFTFYTDVNFLMMLIAYGGEGEDLGKLSVILKSLIAVDDDTDEARNAEWQRFVSVLASRRGMDVERSLKFMNDLLAAAGKDQAE